MKKGYTKFQFELGNQKILILKENLHFKIVLYTKNNLNWIENANFPLINLENHGEIYADKLEVIELNEQSFSCLLEKKLENTLIIKQILTFNKKIYPWIHIKIEINSKDSFIINKFGPEILINLDSIKQKSKKHLIFAQPTKHTPPTDEWRSNDMPSSYIYNKTSGIETFFFIDFSKSNWMAPNTIPRFSHYECGLNNDNKFGLYQKIPLKNSVEIKNGIRFEYFISQKFNKSEISRWDALESWISNCFTLIPSFVSFPQEGLSWKSFSSGCIENLMYENYCWENAKYPFYHAYVMDKSEIERRKSFKRAEKRIYETMTALDITPPWLLYLQLNNNEKQTQHVNKTIEGIKLFFDKKTEFFYNNITFIENEVFIIRPTELSIGDSWYFFEPIARLGWLVRIKCLKNSDEKWKSLFKANSDHATDFVVQHNHLISAFYDPLTLKPLSAAIEMNPERRNKLIEMRGIKDIEWKIRAKNYACLGIYIYIMLQSYYFFGDTKYIDNALKSADVLFNISPDELFWEPIENSYGVAGLTELYNVTKNEKYLNFANKMVLNVLRMFYWYNDNSNNLGEKRNVMGLVQACVGIRYPAMKENVETIYPWLILLKTGKFSIDILKFFNLIRINSYYYFSNVIDSNIIYPPRTESPCEYIPFEDLELLESPPLFSSSQKRSPKGKRTGVLGREIYGSGEVIWLYLMFEALACTKDENIMILNLDLFDFNNFKYFPPLIQNFIVFNPFKESKSVSIKFKSLKSDTYTIIEKYLVAKNKIVTSDYSAKNLKNSFKIELSGEESIFITLKPKN